MSRKGFIPILVVLIVGGVFTVVSTYKYFIYFQRTEKEAIHLIPEKDRIPSKSEPGKENSAANASLTSNAEEISFEICSPRNLVDPLSCKEQALRDGLKNCRVIKASDGGPDSTHGCGTKIQCTVKCGETDLVEENTFSLCSDGVDNNGNGRIDFSDWECREFYQENTRISCTDDKDNDQDRLIDVADPDCKAFYPQPPVPPDPIIESSSTFSLSSEGGEFDGRTLKIGVNSIDGIVFTVLPLYSIGETYNNKCRSDCDEDAFQSWSRFESYKLIANYPIGWIGSKLYVFKGSDQIGAVGIGGPRYGALSILTYSIGERDYFILGDRVNCGNGGCNEVYSLFSYGNGRFEGPIRLWDNGWGWGHGGTEPYGSQKGGELLFVISYRNNTFLFSKGNHPIVQVDAEGQFIQTIDRDQPILSILKGGEKQVPIHPGMVAQPILEALQKFDNASSGNVVFFRDNSSTDPWHKNLNIYLDNKKIGEVSGVTASAIGFSPDNRYFAYKTAPDNWGATPYFSIHFIDLKIGKETIVSPRVQSQPYEKNDIQFETLGSYFDSFQWDEKGFRFTSFLLGRNLGRQYYRASQKESWTYDLNSGEYTFLKTLQ